MNTALPINPATIDGQCFCLAARRTARLLSRRYDEALRPADLNAGQFSTLMVVAAVGSISVQHLADRLEMDRTTATAALKPLERRALLTIATDTQDKRSRVVVLTAQGYALLRRAAPLWQEAQRQVEQSVGDKSAASLRAQMNALRA
jgi:DNA-binding MarR family transcriptional regulator